MHGSQGSHLLKCSEKAKTFGYVDDAASLNDIERSLQARNCNSLQTATAEECEGSETIAITPAKISSHVRVIVGRHCVSYPTKVRCTTGKPALVANKHVSNAYAYKFFLQNSRPLPLQR